MEAILALLFAFTVQTPCDFAIVHAAPASLVAQGPDEFLSRLRMIRQPDSPVVVTSIDFHDSVLDAVPGSYVWGPRRITIELLNVSNRIVRNVQTRVNVRWPNGDGGGTGQTYRDVIKPGERVRLEIKGGSGRGTSPTLDEVSVDVSLGSMLIGDCQFTPSTAIPVRQR